VNKIRQHAHSVFNILKIEIFVIYFLQIIIVSLLFLLLIEIASLFVGAQKINLWLAYLNKWFESTSKISYMQSVFSLGAATSAAFAFAGPQIQHALGPRVQKAMQYARFALRKPNASSSSLKSLIKQLHLYDKHKRDDAAMRRSNLFPFHLIITFVNVFFLVWTALIDPRGELRNKYALILIFVCIFAPLIDLRDAFFEAHRIRPIIENTKSACDSGIPEQIDAATDAIEAEIKRYPSTG